MRPGATRTFVTTFERTNLHFSVVTRSGGLHEAFRPLVEAKAKGQDIEPTLIYAMTVAAVDDIVTHLRNNGAQQMPAFVTFVHDCMLHASA